MPIPICAQPMTARPTLRRLASVFILLLVCTAPAFAQVHIDGHITPGEWQGARHVTDFRKSQPFTGDPATYPTQAWILATPKGLAIAFRCSQPPGVPRTQQRVQRDFNDQVDRVNLYVDFDGDGITGYNFTISSTGGIADAVVSSGSDFNDDWDGLWQHAVSQDAQGWTVEMLIPWYTAPMHKAVNGKRTLGIYLDRVIGATNERDAWPLISFEQPRFLVRFNHVEVKAYSQSLLAITPYVSGLYDNVHGRSKFRQGVDVFWKPNGQFQLTATLNPDFGQVESDDLVVNFSATESYFSDKRPFFTENHDIFNFNLLDRQSALIYTRRVGGPADDGGGVSNINAALKLNGSMGTTNYGVMAANERGAAGRTFAAVRLLHDFTDQRLGMLVTHVRRPWLDRNATVLGVDHHWRPTADLTFWTNLVGSDIRTANSRVRGSGFTFQADYVMGGGWRQQLSVQHFDDALQIDDFGYLPRNNLDHVDWEVHKRVTRLASGSIYSSHDWQFEVEATDNDNRHLRLGRELSISRDSNLRNGNHESLRVEIDSAAWDDRITRGHGALFLPPTLELEYGWRTPRHGDWGFDADLDVSSGGLSGNHALGWDVSFEPTYYVSNALRLHVGVEYEHTPDWLVWQHDALIGRFERHQLELSSGFDWSIGARQELRLKLQAIGLDARARDAWIVGPRGRAVASATPIDDFSVRNLGVQLRYRYKLAPLSFLYVVYGRGGYLETPESRASTDLLSRALGLREDEQLLVKLSYRFDM